MAEFDDLVIFGAGGHGRELAWLAHRLWGNQINISFAVDNSRYLVDSVNGFSVHLIDQIDESPDTRMIVALGDLVERRRIVEEFGSRFHMASLIDPSAQVSPWIEFAEGSVVCAGSILTTNIKVRRHVHINVGVTISHDVTIGDFSTISPGAHLAGHVILGHDVFVGTGATIINGRSDEPLVIGDGAVVAAGACVIRPVEPHALVAGVPAVRKR